MMAPSRNCIYRSGAKRQRNLTMQSLVRIFVWSLGAMAMLIGTPEMASADPLDTASLTDLRQLYKQLIDAENAHDIKAVAPFVWDSPSALFVAKTSDPSHGNWAGFWGKDVVLAHFGALYRGTFHMAPDYSQERIVGLTKDVAETYAPLQISVSYAGQNPVPKPFLMIVEWIKTPQGWRMATDIALPVPPAPAKHS
jgi:hypothetical protein